MKSSIGLADAVGGRVLARHVARVAGQPNRRATVAPMRLSTRNQLSGVITEVSRGAVKVELDGGEQVATRVDDKDAAGISA
jgi:hypothetical protein